MIGLSISIYVTYIVYLMAFEQYHRKQSSNSEIIQSISVQDRLNNLQIQDGLFFEKLSFTIRTHLEDSDLVHWATRKTQKEIHMTEISVNLKWVLEICSYFEYAGTPASDAQKIEIIERTKNLLRS
jgi:hypothetical protein